MIQKRVVMKPRLAGVRTHQPRLQSDSGILLVVSRWQQTEYSFVGKCRARLILLECLAARYAAVGPDAAPMREGVDPQIWFGDAEHEKLWPEGVNGEFTATWSGLIELKFSEDYLLRLYVGQDAKKMP